MLFFFSWCLDKQGSEQFYFPISLLPSTSLQPNTTVMSQTYTGGNRIYIEGQNSGVWGIQPHILGIPLERRQVDKENTNEDRREEKAGRSHVCVCVYFILFFYFVCAHACGWVGFGVGRRKILLHNCLLESIYYTKVVGVMES